MKFFDKWTRKFTKTASSAVKDEVKKTAMDLLPKILGVAAMILGVAVFKEVVNEPEEPVPMITNTSITTNNYFFSEMSEDMVERILEGRK